MRARLSITVNKSNWLIGRVIVRLPEVEKALK